MKRAVSSDTALFTHWKRVALNATLSICYSSYSFVSSTFSLESITFARIPRIKAQATVRSSTAPKETVIPPTPVMKIMEATNRFLFWLRSTFWIILKPDTAMKPYSATQTPPITQEGMVSRKAISGVMKETMMQRNAAPQMLMVEAFLVIATQAMDSPYVVFGQPPKKR